MSPQSGPEARQQPAPGNIDLNVETYPFDVVLENLDRTAFFHLFSVPESRPDEVPEGGLRIRERLLRFETILQAPTAGAGVRASNLAGEHMGTFDHRWKFMPNDFVARPGVEPPEERFDPSRPQRFAMLESICRFGSRDGFRGFGTGLTFPLLLTTGRVALGAVGTILDGYGRFAGLSGTYTYVGSFQQEAGFRGSVMIRVADPCRVFGASRSVPAPQALSHLPDPDVTYLLFRGQKRDRLQKTGFVRNPSGGIIGLVVEQPIRLVRIDAARGARGLVAGFEVGQVIGAMTSRVAIDLSNPSAPSTNDAPTPFVASNVFSFFDEHGDVIGSIETDHGEGRSFQLLLDGIPRQPALRFGAVQPVIRGTGCFEGIEGLLGDNSAVGIAPHAITTLYVLRIYDPQGKFRARLDRGLC